MSAEEVAACVERFVGVLFLELMCTLEDGGRVPVRLEEFLSVTERSAVCVGHVDRPPLVPMRRLYPRGQRTPTPIVLKFGDPRRLSREAKALDRMERCKVPRVPRKVLAGTCSVGAFTLHVLGLTFFEGPSLANFGVLTTEMAHLLRKTVKAVHGCGLVHRDIKPDNILIARGSVPFLIDFDCAGDIGETGFRGTSSWASPSALRGLGAHPNDDFYSLDRIPVLAIRHAQAFSTTATATATPPTPPKQSIHVEYT